MTDRTKRYMNRARRHPTRVPSLQRRITAERMPPPPPAPPAPPFAESYGCAAPLYESAHITKGEHAPPPRSSRGQTLRGGFSILKESPQRDGGIHPTDTRARGEEGGWGGGGHPANCYIIPANRYSRIPVPSHMTTCLLLLIPPPLVTRYYLP